LCINVFSSSQLQPVKTLQKRVKVTVYLLTILGVWKLLGAIALLVPRFPRLKEWAYAGTFFAYVGAAASWAARGDLGDLIVPLALVVLTLASWALRPPDRTLGVLFPARAQAYARNARWPWSFSQGQLKARRVFAHITTGSRHRP
jgi:hypothetical protein